METELGLLNASQAQVYFKVNVYYIYRRGGGLHPPLLAFTVKISLIVCNEGFNS